MFLLFYELHLEILIVAHTPLFFRCNLILINSRVSILFQCSSCICSAKKLKRFWSLSEKSNPTSTYISISKAQLIIGNIRFLIFIFYWLKNWSRIHSQNKQNLLKLIQYLSLFPVKWIIDHSVLYWTISKESICMICRACFK